MGPILVHHRIVTHTHHPNPHVLSGRWGRNFWRSLFWLKFILPDRLGNVTFSWWTISLLELFLHYQQFLVLLPVQAILPNNYCLNIEVPVSTKEAICLYKIACAGIPFGLPMAIGCIGLGYICFKQLSGSDDDFTKVLLRVSILICSIMGCFGLSMIIFWIFGGVFLGIWYSFGGLSFGYLTSKTFLLLVLFSATSFLIKLEKYILSADSKPLL